MDDAPAVAVVPVLPSEQPGADERPAAAMVAVRAGWLRAGVYYGYRGGHAGLGEFLHRPAAGLHLHAQLRLRLLSAGPCGGYRCGGAAVSVDRCGAVLRGLVCAAVVADLGAA